MRIPADDYCFHQKKRRIVRRADNSSLKDIGQAWDCGMDSEDRFQRESMLRRAVLAGDESAWRTWYNETFDELWHYVRWRCGGRGDWADEIVQETWMTAVRRVRRFDPRQGSFLVWLRGIAANVVRNHIRAQMRLMKREQLARGQLGQDITDRPQQENGKQAQQIAVALDALPERQEAVLRAKYLEGRSVAEIAVEQGDTPKAIESLLSRARQAFRDVYRGQGDEDADT